MTYSPTVSRPNALQGVQFTYSLSFNTAAGPDRATFRNRESSPYYSQTDNRLLLVPTNAFMQTDGTNQRTSQQNGTSDVIYQYGEATNRHFIRPRKVTKVFHFLRDNPLNSTKKVSFATSSAQSAVI